MTMEEELISLREENKALREQLAQRDELIAQQQAVLAEQNAVIQQHAEQMSRLSEQVTSLRERLAKDSHNSHLPPSSDRFGRKRKSLRTKSEKPSGGQAGHPGASLPFSSAPDEITHLLVERCEVCQQDLQAVAACGRERRQVVDLPSPRLLVREYQAEQKQCPACQQITIAAFPAGVQAPMQYGPHVGATAVYLVQQQLLPLARACEVMGDLLGVHMSEGTIGALITRCAQQLAPVEQQIKEARALGKWHLEPQEVVDWEAQFLRLLDDGDQAHPRATAPPGKRGRCKQSDARNLLDRLRKQQQAVLTFLEDLRVDFDNNLAERDLRMVKVQQKVSGCFRSLVGAQAFARIRGYLSTLRKQGLPLLSSLQATLCGHPVLPSLQRT
jgi:transposase/uncharacterized coiled-coil protein SlyX